MEQIINHLYTFKEFRQIGKVLHFIPEVVLLVLLGTMANGEGFEHFEMFGKKHLESLRLFLPYVNGVPSESVMRTVMKSLNPRILSGLLAKWAEFSASEEKENLQKLFCGEPEKEAEAREHYSLDGKTVRGNRGDTQRPLHVVTAHNGENGFSVAQVATDEKSNEITAIPALIESFSFEGSIITIDAAGTQKTIAELIADHKADYILALKKNHEYLYLQVESLFETPGFLEVLKQSTAGYLKTHEAGHGREEIREYFISTDMSMVAESCKWKSMNAVGMVRSTVIKKDKTTVTVRYYILSVGEDITAFSTCVRGHWSVEMLHWQLDVTFREGASKIMDKRIAENLNIIRKLSISILKNLDFGKKLSVAKKRYALSMDFDAYAGRMLMREKQVTV